MPGQFTEEHYQQILDKAPVGLALCTFAGVNQYVNERYAEILGRTRADILHRDFSYWEVTPRKYEPREAVLLDDVRNTGEFGPFYKQYHNKSMGLIPVRLQLRRYDGDFEPLIWTAVEEIESVPRFIEDPDEPICSSRPNVSGGVAGTWEPKHGSFKRLFFEAPVGLAVSLLENGQLVTVNERYAELLGLSVEDALNIGYWNVTPRKYDDEEQKSLVALRSESRYGPYAKQYIHKTKGLVPVRMNTARWGNYICAAARAVVPLGDIPDNPTTDGSIVADVPTGTKKGGEIADAVKTIGIDAVWDDLIHGGFIRDGFEPNKFRPRDSTKLRAQQVQAAAEAGDEQDGAQAGDEQDG